ncbi:hypothetical protein BN9982_510015 [Mycobacterium tuberculosis]|nr:hypothetical protein BN9982_510015 [Mycobacterium tuberculosis]
MHASSTIGAQNGHWAQNPSRRSNVLEGLLQQPHPRVSSDRGKGLSSSFQADRRTPAQVNDPNLS